MGSRFQEFENGQDSEPLPIGSRVTLNQGEIGPIYGPNHGMDPSSGNEADTDTTPLTGSMEPGTSRGASKVDEDSIPPDFVKSMVHYDSSPGPDSGGEENLARPRQRPAIYSADRRETFAMRPRIQETQNEGEVPLHLRVQAQGPFVRPLSGVDHDYLGAVYAEIGEWRTRLKQINVEISEAQNGCYNDIADGVRVRGWLITGRRVRFLPGIEMIEGRSKDDVLWDELQRPGRLEKKVTYWSFVGMVTILLGAGRECNLYMHLEYDPRLTDGLH